MKLVLSILAAALVVASVPLAQANPTCNTFTQSRTVAGNTVSVSTSSCHDSYFDMMNNYGWEYYTNITSVSVTDASGAVGSFSDFSQWSTYFDNNYGYSQENWQHYYTVFANDGAGDYASLQANEQKYTYVNPMQSGCNEFAAAYGNAGVRTGTSSGYGVAQDFGDGRMLPCNDRSVQESLP
jgi:hypothetical protein